MNIIIGLINGMISAATPILLSGLGGALTYYSGILNISMEGMMLSGAFFAVLGSYYFKSWPMGIIFAICGSLVMALIFIFFSILLKIDEFITGIGINLFSLGITTYLLRQIFKVKGGFISSDIVPIPRLRIPFIEDIPVLGRVLSGQNLLIYVTIFVTLIVFYLVFYTRFGLRLRATGSNQTCVDISGVSSSRIRIRSLIICGVLCGLAGAFLSLGYVSLFNENMTAGRGWISLAAVIITSGNPLGIAFVSLLFGFCDGLGFFMQGSWPSQFTAMIPYIATLISLLIYSIIQKRQLV